MCGPSRFKTDVCEGDSGEEGVREGEGEGRRGRRGEGKGKKGRGNVDELVEIVVKAS